MSLPKDQFEEMTHQSGQSNPPLGYRMPAEWEPQACVWVTEPHNPETWPGCLDQAQQQFTTLIEAMRPFVQVRTTQSLGIATDDSWIRDYGPLFVIGKQGRMACHDFTFNCWGNKYLGFAKDDVVPRRIAEHLRLPACLHNMVLEGGAIEVNGCGSVMTTRQCLLNPNRNAGLTKQQIETNLHAALGTRHVIWLPGGISGDDTDGHIDDVARFVSPDTVVVARTHRDDPDHAVLEDNYRSLREAHDQDGHALTLIDLPCPNPIYYDYPADDHSNGGLRRLPASYANFLISNGATFVPIFGQANDDAALRIFDQAMPDYEIIGVRCEHLVVGLGAIHCLTMQQPQTQDKDA